MPAIRRRPAAPLIAIHRAQLAIGVGPFVPDRHAVGFQVGDIGVAGQKPQQLVDDGFKVNFFGGDQRKTLRQVKAHLVAKDRARAGAGAVGFDVAVFQHMAHEIKISLHEKTKFLYGELIDTKVR